MPFDLKHVRVIYYDVSDPFWGSKLIDNRRVRGYQSLFRKIRASFDGLHGGYGVQFVPSVIRVVDIGTGD